MDGSIVSQWLRWVYQCSMRSETRQRLVSAEQRPIRQRVRICDLIQYGDRGSRCLYRIHSEKVGSQVGGSTCTDNERR